MRVAISIEIRSDDPVSAEQVTLSFSYDNRRSATEYNLPDFRDRRDCASLSGRRLRLTALFHFAGSHFVAPIRSNHKPARSAFIELLEKRENRCARAGKSRRKDVRAPFRRFASRVRNVG